jgi:hypothetical protein
MNYGDDQPGDRPIAQFNRGGRRTRDNDEPYSERNGDSGRGEPGRDGDGGGEHRPYAPRGDRSYAPRGDGHSRGYGGRGGGRGGGHGGGNPRTNTNGCYNCGEEGHISRNCPEGRRERNYRGQDGRGGRGRQGDRDQQGELKFYCLNHRVTSCKRDGIFPLRRHFRRNCFAEMLSMTLDLLKKLGLEAFLS